MAMFEVVSEAERASLEGRKMRTAPEPYRRFVQQVRLSENSYSTWFKVRLSGNETIKGSKQNVALAAKEMAWRPMYKTSTNSKTEYYVRFTNVPRKTRAPRNGKVKVIKSNKK